MVTHSLLESPPMERNSDGMKKGLAYDMTNIISRL